MQIAMLSDVYFPRVNGVSTSIETFRQGLLQLGVATTLLCPAYGGESDHGTVIRLPGRPVPRDPEDRLMSWRAACRSEGELARRQVALIHVQTPFIAHYAGARLARRLGVPLLISYHTLFEEYLQHYLPFVPAGTLRGLARRFSRTQCNSADHVIVPSIALRERLRSYGVSQPISVLPTGIPFASFAKGKREGFRARYGIAPERPVALYVGRVAFEKNIGLLLDMLAIARKQQPELLLLVTGEGPARPALEAQAQALGLGDSVRFLNYLDRHSELADCYASADVFVFASRTETQGLVLLEAMAAGTPVVALAEMGTADILRPQLGAVIAPDNPAGFARCVVDVLQDAPRRQQLSQQAREYAAAWSDCRMAERLKDLYDEIILAAT